jgi:hypothetical protein
MPTMTTMTTATRRWTSAVKERLTAKQESEAKLLLDSIELVSAALPAWQIASLDHVTRAKRISLASIVGTCRKAAAPADDHAKLRTLMERHPGHYENATGGLHQLEVQIRQLTGWRLNPPVGSDMGILRNASSDERVQVLIRAELGPFNPVSLLTIAFENVAAAGEKFGEVTREDDAEEVTLANAEVGEVLEALRSQPALLLASHYGLERFGADPAREVLAAAAARPPARR